MARGWESKSVESQMEAAEAREADRNRVRLSDEQMQRERERDALLLSRKRVLADLERATSPRYKVQLQAALAHVDAKLAALASS